MKSVLESIYKAYVTSPAQMLAYETLVGDVLKGEYMWNINRRMSTQAYGIDTTESRFFLFVKEIVLHLCLYGYCMYRITRSGKFEVAPGTDVQIQWSVKTHQWEPHVSDISNLKGTGKWYFVILAPPLNRIAASSDQLFSDDQVFSKPDIILSSCGYKALEDSMMLEKVYQNILQRDDLNSLPSLYTRIVLENSGGNKKPWFRMGGAANAAHDANEPMLDNNFDEFVQNRVDVIRRLDTLSKEERSRLKLQRSKLTFVPLAEQSEESGQQFDHREFPVTDGRHGDPVPYLRSPEDLIRIIEKLEQRIMFSWNVPPQVLGKNINSERLASSNRLVDVALGSYKRHVQEIRKSIQTVLNTISRVASGNDVDIIEQKPCISASELSALEGIIRPEVCADMYACVYDIPKNYFNVKAIALRQETINEAQSKKKRIEETGKDVSTNAVISSRPQMTEHQKQTRTEIKNKA